MPWLWAYSTAARVRLSPTAFFRASGTTKRRARTATFCSSLPLWSSQSETASSLDESGRRFGDVAFQARANGAIGCRPISGRWLLR